MRSPEDGGSWGILGGSFDPVHNGHINLANWICSKKNLDGVLFVPAVKHPNKNRQSEADYSDRVAMIKTALLGITEIVICEIEAEEKLSGYTIDTIRALKKRYPKAEFYFIIGADNISMIEKWHMSGELKKEIKFLAGSRPSTNKSNYPESANSDIEFIEIPELDISSSEIRKKVREGFSFEDIARDVPASAVEYIFEKGLYR